MNIELWNKILDYDLDNPPSEFGFSTRLANENFWTKSFTDLAILEYKKFMYLAANAEFMVSPSEIVDTVWHQHLIFTQSYNEFCLILGKQIQHIPSTHNKSEYLKFKQAKERTTLLYEKEFGKQPKSIWSANSMYDSLNLEKAKLKIRSFIVIGILALICLTVPAYFLLYPVYVKIDNPYFLIGLLFLSVITFITLEFYNKAALKRIVSEFDNDSFIYNLHPHEVIYAKTQKISAIINGVVNELIVNYAVDVTSKNTIQLKNSTYVKSKEQLQITSVLYDTGNAFYPDLLRVLASKPIFSNTPNCINAFKKYFLKSKKFGQVFYTNFIIFSILILFSFTRIVTGLVRNKPIDLIVMSTFVIIIFSITYLYRLTFQITSTTIPHLYEKEILPNQQVENDLQWNYFLLGNSAMAITFLPVINFLEQNKSLGDASNSSSGCGSSCGSSCSSCGGCGGCGS